MFAGRILLRFWLATKPSGSLWDGKAEDLMIAKFLLVTCGEGQPRA
jgi:hypothetical protein